MHLIGYIASVFIGISLGLIGGGGSILTVPVLVYLFGIDAVVAISYSLFIVGLTSVAGSLTYFKNGLINIRTVFLFGLPSIVAVFLTRSFIVPAIPKDLFHIGNYYLTKDILLLILFAGLMLFASYRMIKNRPQNIKNQAPNPGKMPITSIELQGLAVGSITGLVGAGGGFLIIPALVTMLDLPMKTAVGTSLVIISINSLIGFLLSLPHLTVHWIFLLKISAIAILGIVIGSYLSTQIDGKKLKSGFGWFILLMGSFIILKETILK